MADETLHREDVKGIQHLVMNRQSHYRLDYRK